MHTPTPTPAADIGRLEAELSAAAAAWARESDAAAAAGLRYTPAEIGAQADYERIERALADARAAVRGAQLTTSIASPYPIRYASGRHGASQIARLREIVAALAAAGVTPEDHSLGVNFSDSTDSVYVTVYGVAPPLTLRSSDHSRLGPRAPRRAGATAADRSSWATPGAIRWLAGACHTARPTP